MKRYLLVLLVIFPNLASRAQEISLSDSVIYFDNKPAAYYVKTINESDPHYNIYIISLDMELLLAAQVVKFQAPVRELKSFYYYDLILHSSKDTFSMYHEGQAFPLELAQILRDYKLLENNKINKIAWRKFKYAYTGNADLKAKIKTYENYLVDTRFFNEQVDRDRTKPVTIINDRIIMQDEKKIGLIVTKTNIGSGVGQTTTYTQVKSRDNSTAVQISTTENPASNAGAITEIQQIMLTTNRIVDASSALIEPVYHKNKTGKPNLYDISLPLNKSDRNQDILWLVCQYVETY
ncbi:MAG: hypothetical protein WCG67_10050, partial [Ferruginibacter sp.]